MKKLFQAIAGGGAESTMSKRDRRDLNHLLSLTCQKLSSKMTTDLLYREAPEKAAQKAQDGVDPSDKSAKMVSNYELLRLSLLVSTESYLKPHTFFIEENLGCILKYLFTEGKSKVRERKRQ